MFLHTKRTILSPTVRKNTALTLAFVRRWSFVRRSAVVSLASGDHLLIGFQSPARRAPDLRLAVAGPPLAGHQSLARRLTASRLAVAGLPRVGRQPSAWRLAISDSSFAAFAFARHWSCISYPLICNN